MHSCQHAIVTLSSPHSTGAVVNRLLSKRADIIPRSFIITPLPMSSYDPLLLNQFVNIC